MKKENYKTKWDLGLLYKSENDPQIDKDVKKVETLFSGFEKKYKGKDFTSTAKRLSAALKEYEEVAGVSDSKGLIYFLLAKDIDTTNSTISAKESVINQRLQKAYNKIKFLELDIALLPKSTQTAYLKDPLLKHFNYFLKKIFDTAKYNLSEKEEKLLGLVRQTSSSMWVDANKKLLSEQTVPHNGKMIPISEAVEIIPELPKEKRRALRRAVNGKLKAMSFLTEAEINAVYNFKKLVDEERGFKNPYTSTVLGYENDEKEIEALVKSTTKYFSASRKYYKLHAKLLGEKKLEVADLYANIGEIKKKFDFDSSVKLVKNTFTKFGPEYANILDSYLAKGQIDVYPGQKKRGGGYCMSNADLPTFVLLNFADNIKSVETLAHEMGHAFHGELSRKNSPLYRDYTISVAEVASTFFEQFVSDELMESLSEEEQMVLLHQRVGRDIITVMRQIACFNFELELHQKIRVEGKLSKEDMAVLMNKHMHSYMGDAVELNEEDGYLFVYWSHIRRFFYVYSYAYGLLISRTLYEKWKSDKSYKAKIEQFLSAGGSMSPKDIFKSIGINTNEAFFEAGLKGIEADIIKLEKLAKKYKKI